MAPTWPPPALASDVPKFVRRIARCRSDRRVRRPGTPWRRVRRTPCAAPGRVARQEVVSDTAGSSGQHRATALLGPALPHRLVGQTVGPAPGSARMRRVRSTAPCGASGGDGRVERNGHAIERRWGGARSSGDRMLPSPRRDHEWCRPLPKHRCPDRTMSLVAPSVCHRATRATNLLGGVLKRKFLPLRPT